MIPESLFWADQHARRIIAVHGDKDQYAIASGITPSGTVHIGNFREIITVDLVRRALASRGKEVRFIYSWDDFDRLRKVPANIPPAKRADMETHLGKPVSAVPDPWSCHDSYARHWQEPLEKELVSLGIMPEYLYQHTLFRKCVYAASIRLAMRKRQEIAHILNNYRKEPLPETWYPLRVYCESCGKDTTTITAYDEEYTITYQCICGRTTTIDFRKKGIVKPPWRVDWPMRWDYYREDFEPAGRDHMTPGSSYDTSIQIQRVVYGTTPPYGFMYNFISLKGMGGKMSSSVGNAVSIGEVMKVYLPEIVRFLFAGTKPSKEFAISFDEDVLKVYEDFYHTERVYFGMEKAGEKTTAQLRRIYEMSVITLPKDLPVQPNFKHAVTLINICQDVQNALERAKKIEGIKKAADRKRYEMILERAQHWLTHYAPDSYRFEIHQAVPDRIQHRLTKKQKEAVRTLSQELAAVKTEQEVLNALYQCCTKTGLDPKEFFTAMYLILIGKETGPRLAPFILAIGKEKVRKLLEEVQRRDSS